MWALMLRRSPTFDPANSDHADRLLMRVMGSEKEIKAPNAVLPEWLGTAAEEPKPGGGGGFVPLGDLDVEAFPGFRRWYAAYPVKTENGMYSALREWVTLGREPQVEEMMENLDRWIHSQDWSEIDEEYYPRPTAFLKNLKWKETPLRDLENDPAYQRWNNEQQDIEAEKRRIEAERAPKPKLSHEESLRKHEEWKREQRRKEAEEAGEDDDYLVPGLDYPEGEDPPWMQESDETNNPEDSGADEEQKA